MIQIMEESKMKKVLAILLAILFVVSLTAVAVSASHTNGGKASVGTNGIGQTMASNGVAGGSAHTVRPLSYPWWGHSSKTPSELVPK
jgi:hypothetical protein